MHQSTNARSRPALEPFNGSSEMLSINRSENEAATLGPHEVVLNARLANIKWTTIVALPRFPAVTTPA